MSFWDHVHAALLSVRHVIVIALVVGALLVGWDAWRTVKGSIALRDAIAAAEATRAPHVVDSVPNEPRQRGGFLGLREVGGSGKPWTQADLETAVALEVARRRALDEAAGRATKPPAEAIRDVERSWIVPEYVPPTDADRVAFERRFKLKLADVRPLTESRLEPLPFGGWSTTYQDRLGGPARVAVEPDPRPTTDWHQAFELGVGAFGMFDERGAALGVGPVATLDLGRVGDWHARVHGVAGVARGGRRFGLALVALTRRWSTRPGD